jgi:hypothetical protein
MNDMKTVQLTIETAKLSWLITAVLSLCPSNSSRIVQRFPGLEKFFKDFTTTKPKLKGGVLCLIRSQQTSGAIPEWQDFTQRVYLPIGGAIDLLPSGNDVDDYQALLQDFSWKNFYTDGGGEFIEALRSEWISNYDFVFVDSRTGVTDSGGVCTIHLPDIIVLVFTATEQSLDGAIMIGDRIKLARQQFEYGRLDPVIIPLLSRWDGREEQEEGERWLQRIERSIEPFVGSWISHSASRDTLRKVIESLRVPHVAYFSFGEKLPVLTHSLTDSDLPGKSYATLASLLTCVSWNEVPSIQSDYTQLVNSRRDQGPLRAVRRIFLSLVSDEFRAYRQLLAQDLARSRVEVCTQEKFGNLGATTLYKLDAYLKGCDAVVHVVGDGLGHVPPPAAVDALLAQHPTLLPMLAGYTGLTRDQLGQCSYTQWEAYLALFHRVRLHIYRPDARAPREVGFVADPGEQALQAAHFERIRKLGRDREVFLNAERLSSYVLADLNDLLPPRDSSVAVAASRLRHARHATRLIGREAELALLDAAWNDAHTHLVVIRGKGGEGKTSLVAAWMAELAHKDWRGAERVLDWSFYSQGTRDQGSATADFCFNRLLTELGDPDPTRGSPEDRAQRLARLLNQQRTLLVLDGLEPLQYPPGPMQGRLKDNGMATLLRTLVVQNRGLVVITTRERLPEVEAHYGRSVIDHDLQFLSPLAGAQVLHHAGARRAGPAPISPEDPELQAASREVRGHALTLFLIGNYLRLIDDTGHGGDIRQRHVIRLREADHEVQHDPSRPYGHAFKAMEAYARWFADGDDSARLQLSVLQMLGLFDRPASTACLKALREPPIPGLSDLWHGKPERQWTITLNRLREIKLVEPGAEGSVDTHPLIREYFARQLREGDPQGYRAAHARLFEYLCQTTEHRPDTLDGLQPLYQAVVHGCLAGRQQQACDEVYYDRILRGTGAGGNFSTFKLGASGADLSAVAAFFEMPWSRLSPTLSQSDQAWLLNEAAYSLRALGRLTEALETMQEVDRRIKQEDWANAARIAINLSELEVTLGVLEPGVTDARRAIDFADRIDPLDLFLQMASRTAAADALHQWGSTQAQGAQGRGLPADTCTDARAEARRLFEQAEALQRQRQPDHALLFSLPGFRFCDLILALAERAVWRCLLAPHATDSAAAATAMPVSLKLAPTPAEPPSQQPSPVDAPGASPAARAKSRPKAEALTEAERRARKTLARALSYGVLLDIALDHLTLARVALYRAMLDPAVRATYTTQSTRTALDALRKANTLHQLPQALLSAAIAHYLVGDPATARDLLDEAQQIAERGPMPLYLADVHLHRARLVGILSAEERRKHWPGVDPRTELAQARALIDKHHYGRRFEELADAEAAAARWP